MRLAGLLLVAAALVACNGGRSDAPDATPTPAASPTQHPAPTRVIPAAPIAPAAGDPGRKTPTLPVKLNVGERRTVRAEGNLPKLTAWKSDDQVSRTPMAAIGEQAFVVKKSVIKRSPEHPVEYELWNASTNEFTTLWTDPPGTQQAFGVAEGDWLVTVETGYSLPLARWSLVLRNVTTNESRTIAESDMRVPDLAEGVQTGPAGFAPLPAIAGGRVGWIEFFVNAWGTLGKRFQVYDIASGHTTTLVDIEDASSSDLQSVSLAANHAAWLGRSRGEPEAWVQTLDSGARTVYEIGGDPYSCALSPDGAFLLWDDTQYAQRGMRAKYALELSTDNVVRYAEGSGWGTYVGGDLVSWTPWENAVGFYDFRSDVGYTVDLQGRQSILATVMGDWYVWQETKDTGVGEQASESVFYFRRQSWSLNATSTNAPGSR